MRPNEASFAESTSSLDTNPIVSRKRRHPQTSRTSRSNAPMTFFVRTEEELEQMNSSIARPVADSTFGVQSLDSTQESDDGSASQEELVSTYDDREATPLEPRIWKSSNESSSSQADQQSVYTGSSTESFPAPPILTQLAGTRLSGPLTPLYLRSPRGTSTDSETPSTSKSVSLRSLRLSDDDSSPEDSASQALTSSGDEDEGDETQPGESAPQLVMPSISMPSRKPFTEKGKSLGKLKILVVGPRGSGKTSLITSIVQNCEDIVHVDSSVRPLVDLMSRASGYSTSDAMPHDSNAIKEIYASTRAYPSWWSEVDESRLMRRRRSNNETILERNLCFLDTPGFEEASSSSQAMDVVTDHIEGLLWRNHSFASFSDAEVLSILSGNGGVQVDLVIYMLPRYPSTTDFQNIKHLSTTTNVLPIISKADVIPSDELSDLKSSILSQLHSTDSRPFLFGRSIPNLLAEPAYTSTLRTISSATLPYAISSLPSTDDDNMDASLLMDSTYIQPLTPSELPDLISAIFNPDTAAWLRHSSARKFLQWRRSVLPTLQLPLASGSAPGNPASSSGYAIPAPQPHASATTSGTTSSLNSPLLSTDSLPPLSHTHQPSPFALANLLDATNREERLTNMRLTRWAKGLEARMEEERARYVGLKREERRGWLVERLGELDCECDDGIEDRSEGCGEEGLKQWRDGTSKEQLDPWSIGISMARRSDAGLWGALSSRQGLFLIKVLGGCGIIGALALWLMRTWSGEESYFGVPAAPVSSAGVGAWNGGPGPRLTDWSLVWSQGWWA